MQMSRAEQTKAAPLWGRLLHVRRFAVGADDPQLSRTNRLMSHFIGRLLKGPRVYKGNSELKQPEYSDRFPACE